MRNESPRKLVNLAYGDFLIYMYININIKIINKTCDITFNFSLHYQIKAI